MNEKVNTYSTGPGRGWTVFLDGHTLRNRFDAQSLRVSKLGCPEQFVCFGVFQ